MCLHRFVCCLLTVVTVVIAGPAPLAAAAADAAEGVWVAVEHLDGEEDVRTTTGLIKHQLYHELARGDFAGWSFELTEAARYPDLDATVAVSLASDGRDDRVILMFDRVVHIALLTRDPRREPDSAEPD